MAERGSLQTQTPLVQAAEAALVGDNFTCDNSVCNFHPIFQAINVLPDRLEVVVSPNLSATATADTDKLTSFYTKLGASLDCSTPPSGATSGTITTVFAGSTELAAGMPCGAIAQAYWIDDNLTQTTTATFHPKWPG